LGSNSRFADLYLERYASGSGAELPQPDPDLFLSVVIPSYKEPDLISSVRSLLDCDPPGVKWEIIVVVNYPEGSPAGMVALSRKNVEDLGSLSILNIRKDVTIHSIWCPDLPAKHAGVGLARKIGMDEAVRRFNLIGNNSGVISGFDADSQCGPEFLKEMVSFYRSNPKAKAANHYFEHPLTGNLSSRIYGAIAAYELYLRYLRFAIENTGHPHAIHTVGSSFSVRAETYVRVNGMGTHAAGEDFYFLHKCILLGRFYEINTVTVFPSPRESDRVIFGTGAAIKKQVLNSDELEVYDIESFKPLKALFGNLAEIYQNLPGNPGFLSALGLPKPMTDFLGEIHAAENIIRLIRGTGNFNTFYKSFFGWFNGFMILRYLNFYHLEISRTGVLESSARLAESLGWNQAKDIFSMLEIYRNAEKYRGIRRVN